MEQINLWGDGPVQKQNAKPKTDKQPAPSNVTPTAMSLGDMSTKEVTSDSPIQHFVVRSNLAFGHIIRLEHFYHECLKQAKFEEDRRVALEARVAALETYIKESLETNLKQIVEYINQKIEEDAEDERDAEDNTEYSEEDN